MASSRGRSPWGMTTRVLIGVAVFGAILIALGVALSPAPADELWTDVAKAGLQIAFVTSIGAVVSITLRRSEERRREEADAARDAALREEKAADERRRLDERRLRVFREIIDAYNRVKAVRRTLRALGLLEPTEPLNATQAQGLREQMQILNEAQLSLEAAQRELKESGLFRQQSAMWYELRKAEYYLGECVHGPWENAGGTIWEGASVGALKSLQLVQFAGHQSVGYTAFEVNVSTPLDELTRLLHQELFGEPAKDRFEDPPKPC